MTDPARIPGALDHAAFAELGAALPHAKMGELVELFVCETEFYMTEIASRRAEGDLESVARLARNIVAIAGNLGAVRASALARQLERACRNGQKANSYRLISEMSQACRDASAQMQAWLEDQRELLHRA
ncbi:MAG TPA: Hpt domain-containing protein [Rhizomicrobium sp.]|nr:Hpt domain-containing protein [Rhizomicrobium sp.]